MTKPMSLTGFARRVEYIKAHRKDKKHSESAAVARKLSRQLREVLCDEQYNLNRWPERRPGFYGYLQFFEHCNFFLGHVHPVRPIVFHDINTAVFSRLSVDRFTLAECFNVPLDRPQGNAEFARQTNHGL